MNTDELDRIAAMVVDAAYKVHSQLGPGLLESTYEACLEHELKKRGLTVARQVPQPVHYDDIVIDTGYRLDLIVNDAIIIELKAVENLLPIHQAQLLAYLKLSGRTLGFLINFNVPLIKNGIRRLVRNHPTK